MFRARLLALLALLTLFGLASAFIACDSTDDSPLVAPITGVTVQAETLIAGHGCGTDPTQVFKYVVVVYGADALTANDNSIPLSMKSYTVFQAANIYDCFSDGTFTNLVASNGLFSYRLDVIAFNQTAYVAAGGDALTALMLDLQTAKSNEDGDIADGGTGAAGSTQITNDLATLYGKAATYSTQCTAEELDQVQTLAVCQPLGIGSLDASAPTLVTLGLGAFTTADGGIYSCNADYATVRVTATVGGAAGPAIPTADCTAGTLTIPMATPLATYSLAVTLVKADGTTLGATTCSVLSMPGVTEPVTCQPVQ